MECSDDADRRRIPWVPLLPRAPTMEDGPPRTAPRRLGEPGRRRAIMRSADHDRRWIEILKALSWMALGAALMLAALLAQLWGPLP
jgi:hypothetical protein